MQVVLDSIGKVRLTPPRRKGGPKAPEKPWLLVRVSTTRQGGIATKTSALAFGGKPAFGDAIATARSPLLANTGGGCQYSGAAQCRRTTGWGSPWSHNTICQDPAS